MYVWTCALVVLAGVPPTQLHRYGSLGCVDLPAVLQPLDFVLPQRDTATPGPPGPELDLTAELSSLTFETQPKDPEPGVTAEAGRPELAQTQSGLRDPELTTQDEDFSLE